MTATAMPDARRGRVRSRRLSATRLSTIAVRPSIGKTNGATFRANDRPAHEQRSIPTKYNGMLRQDRKIQSEREGTDQQEEEPGVRLHLRLGQVGKRLGPARPNLLDECSAIVAARPQPVGQGDGVPVGDFDNDRLRRIVNTANCVPLPLRAGLIGLFDDALIAEADGTIGDCWIESQFAPPPYRTHLHKQIPKPDQDERKDNPFEGSGMNSSRKPPPERRSRPARGSGRSASDPERRATRSSAEGQPHIRPCRAGTRNSLTSRAPKLRKPVTIRRSFRSR